MSICLLDTSVFVEILCVPGRNTQHVDIYSQLEQKIDNEESLFLPMATILETGNHIAQIRDGNQRRDVARKFVDQVNQALDGISPFTPIVFPTQESLREWLIEFPNAASEGKGLGDLSIIHDWQRMCQLHSARRVYIWSLDHHLLSYDREAKYAHA